MNQSKPNCDGLNCEQHALEMGRLEERYTNLKEWQVKMEGHISEALHRIDEKQDSMLSKQDVTNGQVQRNKEAITKLNEGWEVWLPVWRSTKSFWDRWTMIWAFVGSTLGVVLTAFLGAWGKDIFMWLFGG